MCFSFVVCIVASGELSFTKEKQICINTYSNTPLYTQCSRTECHSLINMYEIQKHTQELQTHCLPSPYKHVTPICTNNVLSCWKRVWHTWQFDVFCPQIARQQQQLLQQQHKINLLQQQIQVSLHIDACPLVDLYTCFCVYGFEKVCLWDVTIPVTCHHDRGVSWQSNILVHQSTINPPQPIINKHQRQYQESIPVVLL